MSFFQNLFGGSAPKPAAAPASPAPAAPVVPVPSSLPRIAAPTAAKVCQESKPGPPAQALLTPQQTPSQYLNLIEQKQMPEESVKFLAYGLPERESVWWAVQCAQKVSSPANVPDQLAIKAADAWVKNPSVINQKAAADAAAKTDFQTPGAWAAQAAAWAKSPAPPSVLPPNPAPPRLAPHAVAGAVMLAVAVKAGKIPALPKPPSAAVPPPGAGAPPLSASSLARAGAGVPPPPGAPGSGLAATAAAGGALAPSGAAPVAAAAGSLAAPPAAGALPSAAAAAGLASPGARALAAAASGLSAPSASGAAMTAAKAAGAKLGAAAPGLTAPGASPAGLSPSALPGASASVPSAQGLAKQAVSAQERQAFVKDAAPFIKLGIDIASGAVRLA